MRPKEFTKNVIGTVAVEDGLATLKRLILQMSASENEIFAGGLDYSRHKDQKKSNHSNPLPWVFCHTDYTEHKDQRR
jgi:hypothetical protein